MELILAYVAGLLTLINPCVLPVLPLVLGAAVQSNRHAPLALAAGMGLSFVVLGLFVAVAGRAIGLSEQVLAQTGAVLMMLFGLILLVPAFAHRFELATAGLASGADRGFGRVQNSGLGGLFLGGVLLGAVWSPCVGPTLGGAISLASQGQSLLWSALIMTAFALGIGSIMVALGYGAHELIRTRQSLLRRLAGIARPFMGALFLLVGAMILMGWNQRIEGWLLDHLPIWLQDFSIAV